jgi:hypothetical protein
MVQKLAQRLEKRQELKLESELEYTLVEKKVIGLVLKKARLLGQRKATELVMYMVVLLLEM